MPDKTTNPREASATLTSSLIMKENMTWFEISLMQTVLSDLNNKPSFSVKFSALLAIFKKNFFSVNTPLSIVHAIWDHVFEF